MKMTILILGAIIFLESASHSAVIVFGDTSATATTHVIAKNCSYARLGGTMGGSGTITLDSAWVWLRNASNGDDTVVYGIYVDSALTKPTTRLYLDTIVTTNDVLHKYSDVLRSGVTFTSGVPYWITISALASDTSANFIVGKTANTVTMTGDNKCGFVLGATWGSYSATSPGAMFQIAYFGHDTTPSGPSATPGVMIKKNVTLGKGAVLYGK